MGEKKRRRHEKEKMINFCNAIICIAKAQNTFEGDAIHALALEVSNWIDDLELEGESE